MSSVERRSVAKIARSRRDIHNDTLPNNLPAGSSPCITILLCTYNGARFLATQLASLERQIHQNWKLFVSDDGSSDSTLAIVHHFAQRDPQAVEVRQGPRRGPSANFLSLATDPGVDGDYFAFCDQDGEW